MTQGFALLTCHTVYTEKFSGVRTWLWVGVENLSFGAWETWYLGGSGRYPMAPPSLKKHCLLKRNLSVKILGGGGGIVLGDLPGRFVLIPG